MTKLAEKWPNTLVLPSSKDFCIGDWQQTQFDDETGEPIAQTCCLVAWANIAFGPKTMTNEDVETIDPNFDAARLRARNRFIAEVVRQGGGDPIDVQEIDDFDECGVEAIDDPLEFDIEKATEWNDGQDAQKKIARAWRKAASKLNYDVVDTVIIK